MDLEAPAPKKSPNLLAALGRLRRLALKESREILRDRRTLVTLIGMPILLYPILSIVFQQFFLSTKLPTAQQELRVGFETVDQLEYASAFLLGLPQMYEKQTGKKLRTEESRFKLGLVHEPNLNEGLNGKTIDVGVRFKSTFGSLDPQKDLRVDWELIYLDSTMNGRQALHELKAQIEEANKTFLLFRMRMARIRQRPQPLEIKVVSLDKATNQLPISLDSVIPLILILMTITGAVYPAIDLTAGERERGTLEILVAAPVSRYSLLLAKYFAVVSVAMLTAGINLIAMGTTVFASGLGPMLFGDRGISVTLFAQIFCLLVLFAAFFSGLLLALTSFARSFKEAQAYLIPLMLASMAPGVMSLLPNLELTGPLAVAPLLNIVLLARDLIHGDAGTVTTLIVVATTILYSLLAIGIAARVFGAENVLYGEQGSIRDWLRRPMESRPAASLATVMFSLFIIFPSLFVLRGLVFRQGDPTPAQMLMRGAGVQVLLFAICPLVIASLRRVDIRSGFSLRRFHWAAIPAAAVLGCCLWPFGYEIALWSESLGFGGIDPKLMELNKELIERLRQQTAAGLGIFVLGVVPAVTEELFFRGFVMQSLRKQTTTFQAILFSSILFGAFHLVTEAPLISRFLATAALGLALGFVAWRTGSIIPGMILHAIHNSLLVALLHYQEQIEAWGIGIEQQRHIPALWLTGATIGVLGAGTVIFFCGRKSIDEMSGSQDGV